MNYVIFWICPCVFAGVRQRLDHLCYDTAPDASPLKLSCYVDEDMVGKLKKFAMISHPVRMGEQVLNRYAAYCCVRWLRKLTD